MTSREVTLEGGSPWGFRMHGGVDVHQPLRISRVNPGSKASLKGVREGDLITSINGRPTKEITNSEAHTLLKSAGDRLVLGLNEDCQNSPKRRQYKTILHHHRQEVVHETSKTSTSTSHTTLFTTNDPNSSAGKQNTSNNTNGDQVNIDEDTPDGATIPKTNGVVEINEVFEKEAKSSIESTPNVRKTNGLTFANNTNPFRQPVSPGDLDKALESEYENFFEQQEVDETPCVSTATPTPTSAATPTLTPTSSHYSSDTRGVGELVHVREATYFREKEEEGHGDMPQRKKNRHRKNKKSHSGQQQVDKTPKPSNNEALPQKQSIERKNFEKSRLQHVEIEEIVTPSISTSNSSDNISVYRVESPKLGAKDNSASNSSKGLVNSEKTSIPIAKSKSLDDLDSNSVNIKITELKSGDELSDDDVKVLASNEACISEAESDVEWEVTEDLDTESPTKVGSKLSSQEEDQLRYFIDKLNLPGASGARVDTDEEDVESRSKAARSSSAIRQKRNERRQLMQYFTPIYDNARYLEAISEETLDQDKMIPKSKTNSSEEIINVVHVNTGVIEKGKAEVVILDSSSGDDEESETSEDLEMSNSEQKTPPPTPDSSESSKQYVEEIIKDIVIEEEEKESTKHVETFEITVKKIYDQNTNDTTEPEQNIDTEIAVVEQRIHQTELNIAHDQELIDQLQNSLEKDQKEILEAQEEIEHMKSFEKEFKEVLSQKQVFSPKRTSKERSTSRSSESSNSSIGTTVVLNPSLKDMAAITAEAEEAEKQTAKTEVEEDLQKIEPLSLKESCLKLLVDLPFGQDALEELATVSNSLKEFTDSLLASKSTTSISSMNKVLTTNIVTESNSKQEINSNEVIEDQNGVNIISNTSKEELRKTTNESETIKEEMVIQKVVDITGSKKLLDIIIKEKLNNPEVCVEPTNLMDLTNLEELRRLHEARLNAKDKSEWLQLVRTSPAVPKRQLPRESENWVNDGKNYAKPRTPPKPAPRRRRSLPPELQVKQMQYLIEKEKQIQAQFDYVESEKRKLLNEMLTPRACNVKKTRPTSLPPQEEFRQRMYEEYRRQLAEREERKSQKVIKISLNENEEVLSPAIKMADFNDIQKEFMDIVNERRQQNGNHANHKDSRESSAEKSDNDTVLVLDGVELRAKKVPKHLQEFLSNTGEQNGHSEEYDSGDGDGIWSPGQKSSFDRTELQRESTQLTSQESLRSDDNVAPIWTPKSAGSSPTPERKEFRPVSFESPVLQRKNRTKSDGSANAEPPWNKDINSSVDEKKLPTSQSAPGPGFGADFSPRLPKAQNPTITLLQKAREGQIPPKSAVYIEQDRARRKNESPYNSQNDLIYNLRTESISDSDSERPKRVVHHQVRQPYEGIGPTTTHGMPVGLRSEIRDANMTHWYKRMYETIHKHRPSKYDDEEYVTIRYKQRNRARQPFATGYLSEPEAGAYDSDVALSDDKYATLDRRRTNPYGGSSSNVAFQTDPTVYNRYATYSTTTLPNSVNKPKTALKPTSSLRKREEDTTTIRYKPQVQQTQSALQLNKPGKIENYTPGKSSISESEAKKWWDEVMDIFDGMEKQQLQQQQQRQKVPLVQPKGYLSQALKESGYESDSTLVFRRRDETAQQLNPHEQREVYKIIQKGGDVPLHGLRKVVPDRPKEPEGPPPPPPSVEHDPETQENNTNVDLNAESPRKYVENEVTIHYRTPVRQEVKEEVDEHVLARQQADAMRKIYEKDRQRKHQQVSSYSDNELLDRRSRRHTDNFTPSQKSPIPLNRYDDFIEEMSSRMKSRPRSPEPRLVARAVYNFVGQSARELTFKKGDVIFVRRQIDKNWYEGELNAMIGLFPSNYVEIVPYEGIKTTTRRANEGQARAKYNFIAQSHLELSLAKGELVVVTRRVDDNWYEGRIGGRKGIFPMSYVEMLVDPQEAPSLPSSKPVASPAAHSMLLNGSSGGKESMGTHNYVPTFPTQDLGMSYRAKPVQITDAGTYGSLKKNPVEQALHIDIQNDPVPYKALYKYRPQNEDELELLEGDVVQVLEKCDDGWFVGTSERTGAFGTFPGNYVEKIN